MLDIPMCHSRTHSPNHHFRLGRGEMKVRRGGLRLRRLGRIRETFANGSLFDVFLAISIHCIGLIVASIPVFRIWNGMDLQVSTIRAFQTFYPSFSSCAWFFLSV